MAPKLITLVRHGQAHHNVDMKYHLRDPLLTPLGEEQCATIPSRFPASPPVTLLVSSPLKRTLQTTQIGFAPQIASGLPILPLALLQETASHPCDVGSPREELEGNARFAGIDFSGLPDDWTSKQGKWASEKKALEERATEARQWLSERNEDHVVCVLHGGFLHFLTEDWAGHGRLPGTGWENTEFRHYTLEDGHLKETEESKARGEFHALDETELMELKSVESDGKSVPN